jgi:hypothetical protein
MGIWDLELNHEGHDGAPSYNVNLRALRRKSLAVGLEVALHQDGVDKVADADSKGD